MLQCVAVCCSVLQCVAVRCSVLQYREGTHLGSLDDFVIDDNVGVERGLLLQCVAVCCSALQCVAVCYSVLRCVTVCCSVLQRLSSHARLPAR